MNKTAYFTIDFNTCDSPSGIVTAIFAGYRDNIWPISRILDMDVRHGSFIPWRVSILLYKNGFKTWKSVPSEKRELMEIPGIGKRSASQIIEFLNSAGLFYGWRQRFWSHESISESLPVMELIVSEVSP